MKLGIVGTGNVTYRHFEEFSKIDGVKIEAVTIFKMGKGLDDGDIISQLPLSLEGNIKDIFNQFSSGIFICY